MGSGHSRMGRRRMTVEWMIRLAITRRWCEAAARGAGVAEERLGLLDATDRVKKGLLIVRCPLPAVNGQNALVEHELVG